MLVGCMNPPCAFSESLSLINVVITVVSRRTSNLESQSRKRTALEGVEVRRIP